MANQDNERQRKIVEGLKLIIEDELDSAQGVNSDKMQRALPIPLSSAKPFLDYAKSLEFFPRDVYAELASRYNGLLMDSIPSIEDILSPVKNKKIEPKGFEENNRFFTDKNYILQQ